MIMKKMVDVSSSTFATIVATAVLLLCCIASSDSQDECDIYAMTNEDITLPLPHEMQKEDRLKWKHDTNVIFFKKPGSPPKKEDKKTHPNGSLLLTKVNKNETGNYIAEVHNENGLSVFTKTTRLCVIDRLQKPQVKIECQRTISVKFTCTVEKTATVDAFSWHQGDRKLPSKESTLQVNLNKDDDAKRADFRCSVSNKVSSAMSAQVKQNCATYGFVFPKQLLGINSWIVVGSGGGIVVVMIIIVIVCCVCNRRRKRLQLKDEDELRLGWTNHNQHQYQQQQQQQHQHQQHQQQQQHRCHTHPPGQQHHRQQQPAGHTGPRKTRTKHRQHPLPATPMPQQEPQYLQDPSHANGQPHPSPRRKGPSGPDDDEKPPPLPQPRKKAPRTPQV